MPARMAGCGGTPSRAAARGRVGQLGEARRRCPPEWRAVGVPPAAQRRGGESGESELSPTKKDYRKVAKSPRWPAYTSPSRGATASTRSFVGCA
jgi:hypothetical protein